ncbi:MAG: DUF6504 family protein [Smithella sp.]
MNDGKELLADVNYEPIRVECYSGYKVNERPTAFTYQGRRWEIAEILDRWYEGSTDAGRPAIDYFKVRTADGQVFLLRYLSLFDAWSVRV